MSLAEILRAYEGFLLDFPNVVGVGIGTRATELGDREEECLKVYVTRKTPLTSLQKGEVLPKWIEGYPVAVEEVGEIEGLRNEGH